ncbi:MAG: hypothetical protein ACRD2W_02875 [Acidimicrobiales bacterium]
MLQFFGEPAVRDAIDRLAEARRLTVIAGAGASMEIGLPSWEGLVGLPARRRGRRSGVGAGRRPLPGAAREGDFWPRPRLWSRCWARARCRPPSGATSTAPQTPAGLRPGPLARAVAGLQAVFGRRMPG